MARGLHSIAVKNFGILGDVATSLGRLNVLVGPNGSGKTTLLRVIQFLGDAARTQLANAVQEHGGLERLQTRRGRRDETTIGVKMTVTGHAHAGALDEYTLRLMPLREVVRVRTAGSSEVHSRFAHRESFTFKRTAHQGRRITLDGGRLHVIDEGKKRQLSLDKEAFGLAVLPQLGPDQGGGEVRKIQELFTTFRVFDINAGAARAPSDVRVPTPLRADASNLAAFLAFLRDEHAEAFVSLVADARATVPGLKEIHFRTVGGASEAVTVDIEDVGLPGRTPLADASFGTVRALALLALLYDPSPPLLTCVEEIDHGLHPHVFDRLVDILRVASKRTQFLIATHSPALVNRLRPAELIVCERDLKTGLARIPAVDSTEVAKMYEAGEYGLGELWFSGTLGGVPR